MKALGALFVIRVAGNVADDAVIGSVEYAVLHLGVNLVVVMGHQGCGAVAATVAERDFDGPMTHSHIDAIIDSIRPAVDRARAARTDDLMEESVRCNAALVSDQLRSSDPVIGPLSEHGVVVQAAYYSLATGETVWL